MPDTQTQNFGLVRIEVGTSKDTWGGKLNGNMDAIDAALKGLADAVGLKLTATGYTAADVLAKLLASDGTGSGIDADRLDGQSIEFFAPASAVTAAAILTALLTVDTDTSGLNASTLQGRVPGDFAPAGHAHPYLPLGGGTVTGDITRSGAGDYLHHVTPALASGRLFVVEPGASDPTNLAGDLLIRLAA